MKKKLIIKFIIQSTVSLFFAVIIIIAALWSFREVKRELVSSYSKSIAASAKKNAWIIEEKFNDLTWLFDYVADSISAEGKINEAALTADYFKKVYSSIAEDFYILDEEGGIIFTSDSHAKFVRYELLKDIFLKTMREEVGLPTPRLSEYESLTVQDKELGVFLYFDQLEYGPQKEKIYAMFVISEKRIEDSYINNLGLEHNAYAYIIDDDRIYIASAVKEQVGKTLKKIEEGELKRLIEKNSVKSESKRQKVVEAFERHRAEKSIVFDKMVAGQFGTEQYIDKTGKHLELVSFHPIHIKGDLWTFAIKTPYSYVTETLRGSFIRTVSLISLFVFILFINFMYIIYNYRKRALAEFEVEHVSSQLEKETALRKAEYRFKQLYQSTKDIILICDASYKIVEINNAGVGYTGANIKDIANKKTLRDFFINSDDFDALSAILNSNQNVTNFQTEVDLNGKLCHLEIAADKHTEEKDEVVHYYFVIRDISARMKLQHEMIEKEKLESTMALIVTANHEINNPLASIALTLDMLKSETPEDDKKLVPLINVISQCVARISAVLGKLSKINSIDKADYTENVKMLNLEPEEKNSRDQKT